LTFLFSHVTIVRITGAKMDKTVWILTHEEDFEIGKVCDILRDGCRRELSQAIKDIVDELAFSTDNRDYAVITIELR